MNRLIWANVTNPIGRSNFRSYELVTVREYDDKNGGTYIDTIMNKTDYLANNQIAIDDVFYQIIGHYHLEDVRPSLVIGTYYNPETAKRILQDITGAEVEVYSF